MGKMKKKLILVLTTRSNQVSQLRKFMLLLINTHKFLTKHEKANPAITM